MREVITTVPETPVKNQNISIKVYEKGKLIDPFHFYHFVMDVGKTGEQKKPVAKIVLYKMHTDPTPFEMLLSKDSVYRIVIEVFYYRFNKYCQENNADAYVYEFNNCQLDSVVSAMGSKQNKDKIGEWDNFACNDSLCFSSQDFKLLKEVGDEKTYEEI
jgi:hypothetical protein